MRTIGRNCTLTSIGVNIEVWLRAVVAVIGENLLGWWGSSLLQGRSFLVERTPAADGSGCA
ncbi:hypothetical protein [Rhodococcus sp. OK302]|jgi:hypothetical protein|uniref:hypothetical protein n=1 Tax=Rhodococcus sp. OK302 TaxID=1882769 RepID=UPI000B93E3E6|nr:hypothetical protein [Rhodococcus sp. OK302]